MGTHPIFESDFDCLTDCEMEFDSSYEEPKFDDEDLAETGFENVTDVTDGTGLTRLFKRTKPTKPKWKVDITPQGLRYETGRKKVGLFVIFWQDMFGPENFYMGTQVPLKKRKGSGQDVILLKDAMENRGFIVRIYKDRVKREVESILDDLRRFSFDDYDMFGMAITSHGHEKGLIYVHDSYLQLNDFVNAVKVNKTLLRKPKMFFVNACRGGERQAVMKVGSASSKPSHWPTDADLLIHYSTIDGVVSMRNTEVGSWFITALCDILEEQGDVELMNLLTMVNHRVAGEYGDEFTRQVPVIYSTLTRLLYLSKKPITS